MMQSTQTLFSDSAAAETSPESDGAASQSSDLTSNVEDDATHSVATNDAGDPASLLYADDTADSTGLDSELSEASLSAALAEFLEDSITDDCLDQACLGS